MQTFLPYESFIESAHVLDNKRLGKQRVECIQILNTLIGKTNGWKNHPCVKMWKGHEYLLTIYGFHICLEWINRGYTDNCLNKIREIAKDLKCSYDKPKWLGRKDFHLSHQSNLLRKNPKHYSRFFNVANNLSYIWS